MFHQQNSKLTGRVQAAACARLGMVRGEGATRGAPRHKRAVLHTAAGELGSSLSVECWSLWDSGSGCSLSVQLHTCVCVLPCLTLNQLPFNSAP